MSQNKSAAEKCAAKKDAGITLETGQGGRVTGLWGIAMVPLAAVFVLSVAFSWGDTNTLPFVLGGAAVAALGSCGATLACRKAHETAIGWVDCYTAAICAGLVVAEFPVLRGSYNQVMVDLAMEVGGFRGTDWLLVLVLIVISLIGWFGSKRDAWGKNKRWRNAVWYVRLLLFLVGVAVFFYPYLLNMPANQLLVPWLVALAVVVGPIALATVILPSVFAGSKRLKRATNMAIALSAWITLRFILFGAWVYRSASWDVFLVRAGLPVIAALLVVVAYFATVAVRGMRGDAAHMKELVRVSFGRTYQEGENITDADLARWQRAADWGDCVVPVLGVGLLLVAYATQRWYIAGNGLVLATYALIAMRYACRFVDGAVRSPLRFTAVMMIGAVATAFELFLFSRGFVALAAALLVGAWLANGAWRAFKTSEISSRALCQWFILVFAGLACAAMPQTGWSVGRLQFLVVCTVLASAALWATFHEDSNAKTDGMHRMRLAMTMGFGALMLMVSTSAPGAPSIRFADPNGHVGNILTGDGGYSLSIRVGQSERVAYARYAYGDGLMLSEDAAQPLSLGGNNSDGGADVSTGAQHLRVWVTYQDGTQASSDFWVKFSS